MTQGRGNTVSPTLKTLTDAWRFSLRFVTFLSEAKFSNLTNLPQPLNKRLVSNAFRVVLPIYLDLPKRLYAEYVKPKRTVYSAPTSL